MGLVDLLHRPRIDRDCEGAEDALRGQTLIMFEDKKQFLLFLNAKIKQTTHFRFFPQIACVRQAEEAKGPDLFAQRRVA